MTALEGILMSPHKEAIQLTEKLDTPTVHTHAISAESMQNLEVGSKR